MDVTGGVEEVNGGDLYASVTPEQLEILGVGLDQNGNMYYNIKDVPSDGSPNYNTFTKAISKPKSVFPMSGLLKTHSLLSPAISLGLKKAVNSAVSTTFEVLNDSFELATGLFQTFKQGEKLGNEWGNVGDINHVPKFETTQDSINYNNTQRGQVQNYMKSHGF